jgi:Domain of unknown function (DUF4412)
MSLARRSLAPALAAFALANLAPAQDLTVVYKETGEKAATSTQYFTKERMRMTGPEHDSIVEYATGKITSIDHKKKEYSEVTLAEMEAQMKAAAAEMEKSSAQLKQQMESMPPAMREKMEKMMGGVAEATTVTKGGTRKVAGYDCQDYTIAMGQAVKTQTCNTTALTLPVPEIDYKRFAAMATPFQAMANNPMGKGMSQLAEKMKEVQGLALAETTTISILGKTKTSGREAVEVKQGPVDPSVFAIPAAYKKVAAPGFKGGRN